MPKIIMLYMVARIVGGVMGQESNWGHCGPRNVEKFARGHESTASLGRIKTSSRACCRVFVVIEGWIVGTPRLSGELFVSRLRSLEEFAAIMSATLRSSNRALHRVHVAEGVREVPALPCVDRIVGEA